MDAISSMEFDYVASGHYANIVHTSTDQMDNPSVLELSKDMVSSWNTHHWLLLFPVLFGLDGYSCFFLDIYAIFMIVIRVVEVLLLL